MLTLILERWGPWSLSRTCNWSPGVQMVRSTFGFT